MIKLGGLYEVIDRMVWTIIQTVVHEFKEIRSYDREPNCKEYFSLKAIFPDKNRCSYLARISG